MACITLSRSSIIRRLIPPLSRNASSFFKDDYNPPKLSFVSPENSVQYDHSITNPDTFWGQLGATHLQWKKPFDTVSDCNMHEGQHRWFLGGKINVAGKENGVFLR